MFIDSTGAPVVVVKDGRTLSFRRPTKAQLGDLLAKWRGEDRAALLKDLDDAQATPDQRLKAIREFSEKDYSWDRGLNMCFNLHRAVESIALANDAKAADALSNEETVKVSAEMWGYAWQDNPPSDADPQKGQPSIGSSTTVS